MKVIATIEARMRSTRLPGKVLLPAAGRPLLWHMIQRLRQARSVDGIVVATTIDPSCDPIEELARDADVDCFRGSEEDVLDRVLTAAKSRAADVIVETTGDSPLIDPTIVDRVVRSFFAGGVDYCSNILGWTYPRGMDAQVFPVAILEEVAGLTSDPVDHEHVSLYIYEHPERFRLRAVHSEHPEWASLRLTLDTPEDYELIRTIFEELYPVKPDFRLDDIVALVERRPELRQVNSAILPKPVR